jgi:DegV family protein with EDD domain
MKAIGFVCDSTADFPPGLVDQLGLHILPVHIVVDGRDHLHGVSIDNAGVVAALKKKRDIYTRPFLPGECAALYDRLLETYRHIVSFHLSTHLSGNYKSARSALNLMFEEDARRISVLDMGSVSATLGLAVAKSVDLMNRNGAGEDLQQRLTPYRNEAFMAFTVENLQWLKKGGRVSAFSAFVGGMLNIKPIIHLEGARLVPIERHRGKKTALKRLVDLAEAYHRRQQGNCDTWIAYADNLEEVMVVREMLAARIDRAVEEIKLVEIGATIAVHAGPGSVAIAMVPA